MNWNLSVVADATGGRTSGRAAVTRVVTDSRQARQGDLFVAIRGERYDGHDFTASAIASGAALAVRHGHMPAGAVGVEVADTLVALADLAARRRQEIRVPVVAITGSSGKTTTKDLTAAALGKGAHAAASSYNNEVGVPLTVLDTPDDASAVVLEVGSRGIGHITALARVVRPDVAVITNVGTAHLEMFGDVAAVVRAKLELVEALEPGGIAVLPAADPRLLGHSPGATITFGEEIAADVMVESVVLDDRGRASFRMRYAQSAVPVAMARAGRHQAVNAAAAVAAALAAGVGFDEATRRVADASVSPWRMEVTDRPVRGGSVVVVNDAYNANPDSMLAAFETVAAMPGRHIAILGKMQELGEAGPELHRAVGSAAAASGFATVIVVGDDPGILAGAGNTGVAVADVPSALGMLNEILSPGDVVLVKASRATGLESIAAAIGEGVAE